MASMDPVVVVGGCGSLGHHIVKKLHEAGARNITVFDVRVDRNKLPDVQYVQGSISNTEHVAALIRTSRATTIFHTASPMALSRKSSPELFETVNIKGTRCLIDECQRQGYTKALIYTGSSAVIHDGTSDLNMVPDDAPVLEKEAQPSFYAYTKLEAERIVLGANRSKGLLTAVIRGCTIFGEGDNVIPTHIDNARIGRSRLQVGDGRNLYDWTYVGNAAQAHLLVAEALLRIDPDEPLSLEDTKKRVDGEAFVITNDDPWPLWEFARTIGAVAGYPTNKEDVWSVPAWAFYVLAVATEWWVWLISLGQREAFLNREMVRYLTINRTFDITKAKTRLGYRPEVSVREGIERAVKFYQESQRAGKDKAM